MKIGGEGVVGWKTLRIYNIHFRIIDHHWARYNLSKCQRQTDRSQSLSKKPSRIRDVAIQMDSGRLLVCKPGTVKITNLGLARI